MSLLQTDNNCNANMGLSFGLELSSLNPKIKNRWLFSIPGVSAVINALPPKKAGRPGITMKETEFHHISESIWYPMKADWKTVNVTLFDIRCNKNPVFDWLTKIYDPSGELAGVASTGDFKPIVDSGLLKDANLELYDGCGQVLETWKFERCYPQSIEWGELDMDSNDMVMVDIVLRYQRAYFIKT